MPSVFLNTEDAKKSNWWVISDKIYDQKGNNPDQKVRSQSVS